MESTFYAKALKAVRMFDKRCGILTGNVVLDVLFGLKIS
jgi:hypothetical protein